MSGRLTDKFMDQLEQWIGTGPKKFDLLYCITRDGCGTTAFHQKCDNQGPTVTVLYNPNNSVYGGYSPVSWDQSNKYVDDNKAFLFRLQYNSSAAAKLFPLKSGGTNHVYRHADYGPTFGGGHDLYTFLNTTNIPISGGYYALNGGMSMNSTYDSQGLPNDQINNGTMNVTELEVYKITGMLRPVLGYPGVRRSKSYAMTLKLLFWLRHAKMYLGADAPAQTDQGFCCPLTELWDTVKCIRGK